MADPWGGFPTGPPTQQGALTPTPSTVCLHPPKGTVQDMQTPGKNTLRRGARFLSLGELSNRSEDGTAPGTTVPSCRALGIEAPELVNKMLKLSVVSVGIPKQSVHLVTCSESRGRVWGCLDTDSRLVMTLY